MKSKNLFIVILTVLAFSSGCFKDNPIETISDMGDAEELMVYFETQGDFINSTKAPAYVTASNVYSNLVKYYVIDIRESTDFKNGHIEGAKNILMKDLWAHIKSIDAKSFEKIVLVSATGQSAAYSASLLRLGGYENVFSMQWGMSAWHLTFSNKWYNSVRNAKFVGRFDFTNPPKPDYSSMPALKTGKTKTLDKIEERISTLLNEGFSKALVDIDTVMKDYDKIKEIIDYFVVCYAPTRLFYIRDSGHPPGTVRYEPRVDLKSSSYIQTLPANKKIAVYDDTGEIAAYVVAYLRMLGYDAKSIYLGAMGMIGQDQLLSTRIIRLKSSDIMNYPYVTGG